MKHFIINLWKQTAFRTLTVSLAIFAVVWSFAWSIQDNTLNLGPLLMALGFWVFVLIVSQLLRNNL